MPDGQNFSRLLAGLATAALLVAGVALASPALAAAELNLAQYVNPLIGTDDSNSPNPVGGGAGGSTFPGATVPFGMVQFSPDTPTASPSGYRDRDRTLEEFSLTHFNGAGCPNNEDLGIWPVTGDLGLSPGGRHDGDQENWNLYNSPYTKSNEVAAPGYYKNRVDKYGVDVELTATPRTGVARFTFPSTDNAKVMINSSRTADGYRDGSITINGNRVTGVLTAGGFCAQNKFHKIYYSITFDQTPINHGTWKDDTITLGSTSASGTRTGGYLTFDARTNRTVNATIALSFVSNANADGNRVAETGSFDAKREAALQAWNTALNRVQATGGSGADLQKFYTALYHVMQNPNIASDVNGQYLGFDGQVHTASHPVYQNYSGWDIYRSWSSLLALVAPDVMTDVVKSMILDGQQGGLLPRWSHQNHETFVMPGDPGPIVVASAYAFGVRDFDRSAALDLMKKSVAGGIAQVAPIRGNQAVYEANHFLPGNPSESLELSASDFAIAQFARTQGDTATYDRLMTTAQYWRSSFGSESGYVQPRGTDGAWAWPLDPGRGNPFVEGNASQYSWMVTHNLAGVIALMGGSETANQRLDQHFTELNGGTERPYFYIGNEPEHGVPWAYHFTGRPASTSSTVRRVMNESFTTGAGGLPGNDDLGATSAWYVWAAMGLYPVTPGADTLALHGSLFPSILIQRPGGNIEITGGSASSPYVQSVVVNGTANARSYIRYGDIGAGGTVRFTLGGSPGIWGTAASDRPPSFTDGAVIPPAAPDLGPNLALGKSVSGSAACNADESPAKVVDGSLKNGSKWCSNAAARFLQVDLGVEQTVSSFVIKHAGLGGENTGYNTGAFTIRTSTDGSNWTSAVSVSGSRASRTYHPVTPRTARYVRLDATTPANNGDGAARIYEFEMYGRGGAAANLALNRPATADSQCGTGEGPEKAVNGSVSGGWSDKWCSKGTDRWLRIDLGTRATIRSVVVRHAGAGGELPGWNTRDFDLQVSDDNSTWMSVAQIRGNTADSTTHAVTATGRYLRLSVITANSNNDSAARIYELEIYS